MRNHFFYSPDFGSVPGNGAKSPAVARAASHSIDATLEASGPIRRPTDKHSFRQAVRAKKENSEIRIVADGLDLRDIRPIGSSLADSSLRNADLRGADLSQTDLMHANLSGADLDNAKFSLLHTELSGTDLSSIRMETIRILIDPTVGGEILGMMRKFVPESEPGQIVALDRGQFLVLARQYYGALTDEGRAHSN